VCFGKQCPCRHHQVYLPGPGRNLINTSNHIRYPLSTNSTQPLGRACGYPLLGTVRERQNICNLPHRPIKSPKWVITSRISC
jgi:hypothetical protein